MITYSSKFILPNPKVESKLMAINSATKTTNLLKIAIQTAKLIEIAKYRKVH